MTRTMTISSTLRHAAVGAMAVALLAGCNSSTRIASASTKAQTATGTGAITLAETAVEATPRNAAARVALGQAYLKAGRFNAAATSFDDAMELGDNSARTALSLALANVAAGKNREAVALLDDWRDSIPASDLGLALSLAGETSRGTAILAEALRAGENSPKLRQNLAYSYALDGRWREARQMMEQDVPADKIDERISEWAQRGKPEDHHSRIAALLNVPVRADPGQPAQLALSLSASSEQLAAETAATRPEVELAANGELPPVSGVAAPEDRTVTTPVPEALPAVQYNGFAVVQPLPSRAPAPQVVRVRPLVAKAAAATPRAITAKGSHLTQLGAFSSPQGARRAWGIFAKRNPELRNYRMAITTAKVNGKNFWRVAAAGFNANGASNMCSSVKARGGVCFAYASSVAPRAVPVQLRANAVRFGGASQKARRR